MFLRGMRHIQLEPVWGGRSDTAGTLRATCALALVQCRTLTEADLLAHLVELFGDKDKAVRVEVARAIEQVGSTSALLLLRLRAVLGADEPEVLGACYSGVLHIEGMKAISWVARFLATGDDPAAEAALAIAGTHTLEGFFALKACLAEAADPWFRSVVLSAIALTRQDPAMEFLLESVRRNLSMPKLQSRLFFGRCHRPIQSSGSNRLSQTIQGWRVHSPHIIRAIFGAQSTVAESRWRIARFLLLYCSRRSSRVPPENFAWLWCRCLADQSRNKISKRLSAELPTPQAAARRSSACPNFSRPNISASTKIILCSILPSLYPGRPPKNWRPRHAATELC